MGLRQEEPTDNERADLRSRFGIAADNDQFGVPEDHDIRIGYQKQVRELIYDAATAIQQVSEPGREQSLALTHLEEALMWAGKALHK